MIKRIVNIRYIVNGLHFDAAIDCNWTLHAYSQTTGRDKVTPVELYCFDRPDWDIRMMYQSMDNQQNSESDTIGIYNTACDFDGILSETEKWIEEMEGGTE